MKRVMSLSFLLLSLAACAGPGGVSPDGGLSYQVPDAAALVYLTGDTSNIDIDAGAMGSFRMRSTSTATVEMNFARGEGGVQVTARFQDLDARMTQPMGSAITADEEDVEGDIVFTLDRKGHATVVSIPELKGQAGQLANPHGLAYQFFPLLPGEAVNPGDTWTDTIAFEAELPEGSLASSTELTYTVEGETAMDGMTFLKVNFEGEGDVTGSGVSEGMDVIQTFGGAVNGHFLWDAARSVMVFLETNTDMSGTVEVPAAGMPPMPMKAAGTSRVKLQGS